MADETDAIRELTDDLDQIEGIFRELEALPNSDWARKHSTERATIELVRHFVSEEEFLYPVLRDGFLDGADLVKRGLNDHDRAEQLLRSLEAAEVGTVDFGHLIDQLLREVRVQTRERAGRPLSPPAAGTAARPAGRPRLPPAPGEVHRADAALPGPPRRSAHQQASLSWARTRRSGPGGAVGMEPLLLSICLHGRALLSGRGAVPPG